MPPRSGGPRPLFLCLLLLPATLAMGLSQPRAGTLEVSPVITELAAGQTATILSVTNRNPHATTVQVRSFAWTQPDGRDRLDDTAELLVSPPMFELPPGGAQTVRLILRGRPRPDGADRNFRLLVDEIPSSAAEGNVRFALRLSLPVFAHAVASPGAQVEWRMAEGHLVARNHGARHARLTELRLAGAGTTPTPLRASETPYLLPGAERRWPLDGLRLSARGAVLTGASQDGPFRVEIAGHAAAAP